MIEVSEYTFVGLTSPQGSGTLNIEQMKKFAGRIEASDCEEVMTILSALNDVVGNQEEVNLIYEVIPIVIEFLSKCLEVFQSNPSIVELIIRIFAGISRIEDDSLRKRTLELSLMIMEWGANKQEWPVVDQTLAVVYNSLCKCGTQQQLIEMGIHRPIFKLVKHLPLSAAPTIIRSLNVLENFVFVVADDPSVFESLGNFIHKSFLLTMKLYGSVTKESYCGDELIVACLSYMKQLVEHRDVREWALAQGLVMMLMSKSCVMDSAIEIERLLDILDVIVKSEVIFEAALFKQIDDELLEKAVRLEIPDMFVFLKELNERHLELIVESGILAFVIGKMANFPFGLRDKALLFVCDAIERMPTSMCREIVTLEIVLLFVEHLQVCTRNTIDIIGSALMKVHDSDPGSWSEKMAEVDCELCRIGSECEDPYSARQLHALYDFLFPPKS